MKISPRRTFVCFTAVFIWAFCTYLYSTNMDIQELFLYKNQQQNTFNCSLFPPDKHFEEMISKYATDGVIVLSLTDLRYSEMAENLYESSFKRFNIDNYLFVTSHEKAEQYLISRNIHAITLWNETVRLQGEFYPAKEYKTKTNFKTEAVYMALCLGYTVLLVDVDIVFLQNPLPYLMQFSKTHDLIIQNEYGFINSGFYLAKAHSAATLLHERMFTERDVLKGGIHRTNQYHMNDVVRTEMRGAIRIKHLDRDLFPWARRYMLEGNREFAGDNNSMEAVIFHCTDSYSLGIKRYRLRELLMWHLDNDRYYSRPDRKYLTFELPVDLFDKTAQARSLSSGFYLALLMNRTLILPEFYCREKKTPLHHCNYYTCLEGNRSFRLDAFEGLYREHMFLHHPLVPHSVKQSQSDMINIRDIVDKQNLDENDTNLLLEGLKDYDDYSVIRLHNLDGITIPENSRFVNRFNPIQEI